VGSDVSGLPDTLSTPVPEAFSPELVGSITQPPQFVVVEEPAGLAVLYAES
jgi:hypothetical protein